jgi:hypothetical protein
VATTRQCYVALHMLMPCQPSCNRMDSYSGHDSIMPSSNPGPPHRHYTGRGSTVGANACCDLVPARHPGMTINSVSIALALGGDWGHKGEMAACTSELGLWGIGVSQADTA